MAELVRRAWGANVLPVKDRRNFWALAGMMVVFAITRWPGLMPQNFSAAYGLAFCAGVYFPAKTRWVLPLGTMLLMDLLLNVYYRAPLLDWFTVVNLITFGGIIWIGTRFFLRFSWLALFCG